MCVFLYLRVNEGRLISQPADIYFEICVFLQCYELPPQVRDRVKAASGIALHINCRLSFSSLESAYQTLYQFKDPEQLKCSVTGEPTLLSLSDASEFTCVNKCSNALPVWN
jgi:hypothetical protein